MYVFLKFDFVCYTDSFLSVFKCMSDYLILPYKETTFYTRKEEEDSM